jgi:tetratricopeptide (TPR) repeat protein
MRALPGFTLGCFALVAAASTPLTPGAREREARSAQVTVQADRAGCTVELDAQASGKTNAEGTLVIPEVEPGDHYLHIECPGEHAAAYFISPHAGDHLEIRHPSGGTTAPEAASVQEAAAIKIRLRGLVQQAVQLRAKGRLDEAVELIRQALKLDPENSDLHRELGITFLLGKEWKRARVEMLEALRHDPSDADAHNGLGYALEKLGYLGAALKEYRLATRLDPDDPTYRTHYFDALSKVSAEKANKK